MTHTRRRWEAAERRREAEASAAVLVQARARGKRGRRLARERRKSLDARAARDAATAEAGASAAGDGVDVEGGYVNGGRAGAQRALVVGGGPGRGAAGRAAAADDEDAATAAVASDEDDAVADGGPTVAEFTDKETGETVGLSQRVLERRMARASRVRDRRMKKRTDEERQAGLRKEGNVTLLVLQAQLRGQREALRWRPELEYRLRMGLAWAFNVRH